MVSSKAILQTLVYSDLFDYPLTKEEIWRFLISQNGKSLPSHLPGVSVKLGFYFFSGRTEIINKRLEREKESIKKLELAKKIISKLSIIPTIQLIAVSGALAMKNSDKDDDIDLFVITKKNTLWTTRLLILLFLQILGFRRKRKDKKVANKICLNMLVDESLLSLSKERQDLYTAHEIVQMMPVFDRDNTYKKFIWSNSWVKEFLPNALLCKTKQNRTQNHAEFSLVLPARNASQRDAGGLLVQLSSAFEVFAKKIQLYSIRKHQTIEEVSDHLLAFHPIDYKNKILKLYNKNLKKYGI